jgi:hypothetical protein
MTWRDMITNVLQDLRVYGAAQVAVGVSPEDEVLALGALNDWLDALKADGLSMFQQARTTWALTSAASYTIGMGGAINVARPVTPDHIAGFAFLTATGIEQPLGPPMTDSQYGAIPAKGTVGTYPIGFYYRPTFSIPDGFGLVIPYPIGVSGAGVSGVLYSGVPVDEVADVTATIVLPPGYRRCIRKMLATDVASAFGVALTSDQKQDAKDAKRDVEAANERLDDLSFGVAGVLFGHRGHHANIYTGDE